MTRSFDDRRPASERSISRERLDSLLRTVLNCSDRRTAGREASMKDFVVHANVEHFFRGLASSSDARQRGVILGLLAEEIEKLPEHERATARLRMVLAEEQPPTPAPHC